MRLKPARPDTDSQEGFVIVAVAASLVVLIGFLALGVSTGYLYSARTTSQEIGDGAALAGAYTYIADPLDPTPGPTAEYHAEQFALARAAILGIPLTAADIDAVADVPNHRVSVTIRTTQPTFFARVFDQNTADVQTLSVAEAGSTADAEVCTRPFFIPNDVLSGVQPDCDACDGSDAYGTGLLVFDDPTTVEVDYVPTGFATDLVAAGNTQFPLYPGNPGNAIAPGQYYLIDLVNGENAGASDIADWIRGCDPDVNRTECGDVYSVRTGAVGGGLMQGLWGNGNTDGLLPDPPDTYDPTVPQIFDGTSGAPITWSPQMVLAPIWDVCDALTVGDYCNTGTIGTGTNVEMPIIGFAKFFLIGTSNGPGLDDVDAWFTGVTGCGEMGDDDEPSGSTVQSLPLRLVNLPDES